jgi:hypothetical protein
MMSSKDDLTMKTTVGPDLETTARKYVVPETTVTPTSTTTNNDSIVAAASGLRAVSIVLSAVTSRAAQDVIEARAAIENAVSSDVSASLVHRQTSETDVIQNQEKLTNLARPGLPSLNSYSLNTSLNRTLGDLISSSRHLCMPIVKPGIINVENRITPDIDQAELDLKRSKGVSDAFCLKLTFSVPAENIDNGDVKSLRVFRSDVVSPLFARTLSEISLRGMGIISSLPLTYRSKNDDTLSMLEHRFNFDNIANELTTFNPFDRFINLRVVAGANEISRNNIDRSVSENIHFIEARRLQNPTSEVYSHENVIVNGRGSQTNLKLGDAHSTDLTSKASKFQFTVNKNNNGKFKQIYASTPSGFFSKRIGDRYYFTYDDTSVIFGRQYQYYVVSVNKDMIQSNRSPLTVVDVDGLRVPPCPKNVIARSNGVHVTLVASVDDQLVEKFEVWKKDDVASKSKMETPVVTLDNGFSLITEMSVSEQESGANWIDNYVIPGHGYTYRVYSVDIFGNKSETPYEVKVTVPNNLDSVDNSLTTPSILAEVDSKTQKMKITIYCPDENVKKIRLERRDLSIDQKSFVVPTEGSRVIMGQRPLKHSSFIHGERIQDADNNSVWTGYFENTNGKIDFIDRLVSFDRTYQYRVHGVNNVGNRTSYDYSRPVLVYRRPMINTPVNFSSTFVTGTSGETIAVKLSWNSASLDVSAEDKFGSQNVLADTAVRTLYQIERKKEGERWLSFNMVQENEYIDPVVRKNHEAPGYRPSYLELNSSYEYRVQAVLSGGYISNKTDQLSVFVSNNIARPTNFSLRTPDPRVRPLYIMLNWNTSPVSGIVDYWKIERAEINNFAAARVNLKNPEDFKSLKFKTFRTVYREASRFRSFKTELDHPTARTSVITGQHHFLDAQVSMGNTYFYKISAVDIRGNVSEPVYRGMKLTHTSYERIIDDVLTETERVSLTQNFVPSRISTNITIEQPLNTMGLNPRFSAPRTTLQIVRVDETEED